MGACATDIGLIVHPPPTPAKRIGTAAGLFEGTIFHLKELKEKAQEGESSRSPLEPPRSARNQQACVSVEQENQGGSTWRNNQADRRAAEWTLGAAGPIRLRASAKRLRTPCPRLGRQSISTCARRPGSTAPSRPRPKRRNPARARSTARRSVSLRRTSTRPSTSRSGSSAPRTPRKSSSFSRNS